MKRFPSPRTTGLMALAASFALAAAAGAQSPENKQTLADVQAALRGDNVPRQRAALALIAEVFREHDPEAALLDDPQAKEAFLFTGALIKELHQFQDRAAKDPTTLALWLKAYGRLFPAADVAAPRIEPYLSREPKPSPPEVTRAASEAVLTIVRHETVRLERPQLDFGVPPAEILAEGGFHHLGAVLRIQPLVDRTADFAAQMGLLVNLASQAAQHRDEQTRRNGVEAIQAAVLALREKHTDPFASIDRTRIGSPLEAQMVAYFVRTYFAGPITNAYSGLSAALNSPDPQTRLTAARAAADLTLLRDRYLSLRRYGFENEIPMFLVTEDDPFAKASPLLPALVKLFTDPSPKIRLAAVEAIENTGSAGWAHRQAVAARTQDPDVFVRWVAARALGRMVPDDIGAADAATPVSALAGMMRDVDIDARTAALNALGRYGKLARSATGAVVTALNHGDADVRIVAVGTLQRVAPPEQAVNALIPAVRAGDVRVRRAAAETLGRIGEPAKEALPALRDALNDPDPDLRLRAGRAILAIDR